MAGGASVGAAFGVGRAAALAAIPGAGEVVAILGSLTAAVGSMRDAAERINAANRPLARYNGYLATEFKSLDASDIRRSFQFARATQGSAVNLVRAVDQMRDNWAGYDQFQAELSNRAGGFFAGFSGQVGKDLSATVAPVTARLKQADPNALVSTGAGAGMAASLWAYPGEVVSSAWNNPVLALATLGIGPLFMGAYNAGQRGAQVADQKVTALAQAGQNNNTFGTAMHYLAAPGPQLKRPVPRW